MSEPDDDRRRPVSFSDVEVEAACRFRELLHEEGLHGLTLRARAVVRITIGGNVGPKTTYAAERKFHMLYPDIPVEFQGGG